MIVKLVLFARAKELVGSESLEFELDDDVTVGGLKCALIEKYPALLEILEHCTMAVDQEYSNDEKKLYHGCEVGCIPPVSGG